MQMKAVGDKAALRRRMMMLRSGSRCTLRCVLRGLFQNRRGPSGEELYGRWGIHPLRLEVVGWELVYTRGVGDLVVGGDVARKMRSMVTAGGLGSADIAHSMG